MPISNSSRQGRHASLASNWTIVIPVKGTSNAKSRLNATPKLASAIALDTVSIALEVARVFVVTTPAARPLYEHLGAQFVEDPSQGLNAAIDAGLKVCPPGPVAIMLGDLPALTASELTAALAQAGQLKQAMVSDTEGTGTVLLTASGSKLHRPSFGARSRLMHQALGYRELSVHPYSGLRRDVDTLEHLQELMVTRRLGPRTTEIAAIAHTGFHGLTPQRKSA
ncbi:2-phospho-L-lactate guanylyltransferase [Arthrobacter sp. MYb23]|uniref:2-phospho-L-lactate guanylyltransferase n=1 Tax=unclassified Arthrobacter TaxID=235627 RepID=UPI000CFC8496|nr:MULTISPECIES: 2-phospho-L-lactate guanylyltransferase [unclassified Arthrobacter]PRB34160.1 2-phospho-L-lactate guanylyltransferase [Arthrobacter sp. MYb51]PRB88616.1 2-phospho-L-lactate guanylyltransferase [Arthrobacter sp. MYb23]